MTFALLSNVEDIIVLRLGWPAWALRTIATLLGLVVITTVFQACFSFGDRSDDSREGSTGKKITFEFRMFQLQYLSVYLIIMLADWLQGTNMYTLYSSYGMNVGTLFLTGFLSSAVFGTFLGMYVDTWGRKLGCIVFCVLEIVINLMEHIPSMPVLIIGRILGGISTSLLFTAFESWMVSEHRKRGFEEEWLASTFSIASWSNGFIAICAGFLAQIAADAAGDIGPFQLAILLTVVSLVLILFWRENYGLPEAIAENSSAVKSKKDVASSGHFGGMVASIASSVKLIRENPLILYLGLSQAFFEGAVYTFVFMWVPSLLAANAATGSSQSLPTGLVFSSFMLAMTLGGMLFGLLLPLFPGGAEGLCLFLYVTAAASMMIPCLVFDFWSILIAFLILESMLGMFNSCGATLRSQYYPEQIQSSVMSVFRLPLNLLVVCGTLLTNQAKDVPALQQVFGVVVGMLVVASLLQVLLLLSIRGVQTKSDSSKIRGERILKSIAESNRARTSSSDLNGKSVSNTSGKKVKRN